MNKLGRALQFFRPDADRLAVVVLLILSSIGLNLMKPWPLAVIVDCVLGTKPLPAWLGALAGPAGKERLLLVLCVALLLLHLGQSALSTAQNYLAIQVGLGGLRRIRDEVFT